MKHQNNDRLNGRNPMKPQNQYQTSYQQQTQGSNDGGQMNGQSNFEEINRLNARVRELESQIQMQNNSRKSPTNTLQNSTDMFERG